MAEIRNPNQQPGGERNLLIIFALTFLLLIFGQSLFFKKSSQQQQPSQAQQQATPPPAQVASAAPAATPVATAATPQKIAQAETETVVENGLYRITFTNRGAQVKSWILKNYKDNKGQPLELVHQQAAAQYGFPLSLWTWDEGVRNRLNAGLYVSNSGQRLAAPATLVFEFADGEFTVRKQFQFDHSYAVRLETSIQRNGSAYTAFPAWPSGFGDDASPASYAAQSVIYQYNQDVTRLQGKKVSGGNTVRGPFHWVGVNDQYFAALFLPDDPNNAAAVTLRNQIHIAKNPKKPDPKDTVPVEGYGAAAGSLTGATSARLYVGPKALEELQRIHANTAPGQENGPNLSPAVDFGTYLGFIAKPLFLWLRWTHDHWVGNWGWAIIILTIIINVALLPLRLSSMKSALKMQKIQPQMRAIQEKYKKYKLNDPARQEQNKELSALYKQHGVNPVGGCLPMLLQMPFLIAFWSMLNVAIELRQAQWLWLNDLSTPDRYYIIPALIVVSMLAMQALTPMPGMDPMQARMMKFMMPAFLGWISLNYASGLGLYFTMSNVISYVQQLIMNRTPLGMEIRALQTKQAQKRALKGR